MTIRGDFSRARCAIMTPPVTPTGRRNCRAITRRGMNAPPQRVCRVRLSPGRSRERGPGFLEKIRSEDCTSHDISKRLIDQLARLRHAADRGELVATDLYFFVLVLDTRPVPDVRRAFCYLSVSRRVRIIPSPLCPISCIRHRSSTEILPGAA